MIWTIPNILTIFRLLCAPAVAFCYLFLAHPYSHWVALALFCTASFTDYLDGYIARRFNLGSKFGAMLDPIADKAMVVIALCVLAMNMGPVALVIIPAVLILLRETFVSGLREYLGDTAGTLKVTKLAKWKTTVQMLAIAVLMSFQLFSHYLGMGSFGMDGVTFEGILSGEIDDPTNLRAKFYGYKGSYMGGVVLLWIAAVLTLLSGADYLRKSLPYLRERPRG